MIYIHIVTVSFLVVVSLFFLFRNKAVLPELLQSFTLILLASVHGLDLVAQVQGDEYFTYKWFSLLVDGLIPLAMSLLPLWLFQRDKLRYPSIVQSGFLIGALLFIPWIQFQSLPSLFFNPDIAEESVLFIGQNGIVFFSILCIYTIYGLYHIEQAMLGLNREEFWQGKFYASGWGLLVFGFLFSYSNPVVFRTYDLELLPVRTMTMLFGGILLTYSRLWRGDVRKLMVSRVVAYRSIVLLAVGGYLLLMAVWGHGFSYLHGPAQRYLLSAFFVAGVSSILIILLIESVRRRIKVFLHKHFYQNKYEYRQQWLNYTRKLSEVENEQQLFQSILEFFCTTFGMKGGVLFLRENESRICFRGCSFYGCERSLWPEQIDSEDKSITALGSKDWILDSAHPDDAGAFTGTLSTVSPRFLVPIHFNSNLEGILALTEPIMGSENYGYEDFDLMRLLAAQAGSVLHGLRLRGQLANEQEMAAIGKVSTFVVHDLKNLVTSLNMMVENAKEYLDDPEFQQDMLETVSSSVEQMKSLIQRLRYLREKSSLTMMRCDLVDVVETVLQQFPQEKIEKDLEPAIVEADPAELGKVVQNLVHNAFDAITKDGQVRIATGCEDRPFLSVSDTGVGMSQEFMDTRLFKPLETTKEKGLGVGLYQCRHIIEAHGGGVKVSSRKGQGTEFYVWLPSCNDTND